MNPNHTCLYVGHDLLEFDYTTTIRTEPGLEMKSGNCITRCRRCGDQSSASYRIIYKDGTVVARDPLG